MGHQVNYYTTKVTNKKDLKAWISRITECAYDPMETSSYHGHLTIHDHQVYGGYNEALDAIKRYDNGWYDDHIVEYRAPSKKSQKAFDDWNQKRDSYIEAHSIHKRTSKYIGCPECGSKLYLSYVRGEKCPLCHTDLRPATVIKKIRWYDTKAVESLKKDTEEYWLAKIEYHC